MLFVIFILCVVNAFAQEETLVGDAFEYLIPSHESIPQNQFEDFVVDLLLIKQNKLHVSLYAEENQCEPLKTWDLKRTAGVASIFSSKGVYSGKLILPGKYILRFTAGDDKRDIPLRVTPPQELLPLQLTVKDEYLPLSSDENEIRKAMIAPLAVVDIGELGHESIYDAPNGKKIGHVHGQTAGLMILKLNDNGYAKVGAFATEDGSYIEGYIKQEKLKMLKPNPRYCILVNKLDQTMSVYEANEKEESGLCLLGQISISTGLMVKNKLFQETRAGAFFTRTRLACFTSYGYRYDYPIRIDGGNLLHEAGHKINNNQKNFSDQVPLLGSKNSHGCIRIDPVGKNGLNAFWLWQHLPRNTKVLVMDDPNVRMSRLKELDGISEEVFPTPSQSNLHTNPSSFLVKDETAYDINPGSKTRLIMSFMGDSIIGSEEKSRMRAESFDSTIIEKGYSWPFSGVQDIISKDDLSIINFEGVLKDDTRGKEEGRQHWFRGPLHFAKVLPAGSIEIAGLANNHMRDYGITGHTSTIEAIENEGVATFGYFDTYIHEHQGLKIGFGGIRETIWRQNPTLPNEEISALKKAGCDYIVYTIHAGQEYNRKHTNLQTKIAHSIIDAGADLIIGAHPHVIQGIEKYKQGLIVYSLGNFSFGGNLKLTEFDGLIVQAELEFEGRKLKETTLHLIPVLTTGTIPNNDFRPIAAKGKDKARILKLIQNDSENMEIKEEMSFAY